MHINIQQKKTTNESKEEEEVTTEDTSLSPKTNTESIKENEKVVPPSQYKSFCKSWFKIVWKMRSVYCAFAVHVFDVLTDVLVLIQWWTLEHNGVDVKHIDAKVMALCMVTLLIYKVISTAFWAKEKNIIRCILQFLDF